MKASSIITRPHSLNAVLVASHPRSGTHLVIDLLRRQFRSLDTWRLWGLPLDHLYLNLERLGAENRRFPEDKARKIVNRPKRALMKTHFNADFTSGWAADESAPPSSGWLEFVEHANTIYVMRHPLDVMVSYHQFLCGIHPEIADIGFVPFLRGSHWDESANRLQWWARHIMTWQAKDSTLVLRYEDVVRQTDAVLTRISQQLNEEFDNKFPLLPPKVTSISRTRLDRLLRLSPSSTSIVADRNRFRAFNWRESLTNADMGWIDNEIGPVAASYGYTFDRENPVQKIPHR